MGISKVSDFVASGFFKPKEHMNDLALLIEPVSVARNQPNTYQGKTTTRDEVLANISVFANQADVEAGKPSQVLRNYKVVHGMLTSTLEQVLGGAIISNVEKINTQNGSGYVFRDVKDAAIFAKVEGYYDNREAAAASAPSFD